MMSRIVKFLLGAALVLLFIIGVEIFMYLKASPAGNFSIKSIINKISGKADQTEVTTLPEWNSESNAGRYKNLNFDGPAYIGENKNGDKVVLYYQGEVESVDKNKNLLVISNNNKTEAVKIGNEVTFAVAGTTSKIPFRRGTWDDLLVGRSVRIIGNSIGGLNIIITVSDNEVTE